MSKKKSKLVEIERKGSKKSVSAAPAAATVAAPVPRTEDAPAPPRARPAARPRAVPAAAPSKGDAAEVERLWLDGKWAALAEIGPADIESRPGRDRSSLYIGYALQQLGSTGKAEERIRAALAWGCPPRIVARVLLAGAHNTLGNIFATRKDEAKASRAFARSVDVDIVAGGDRKKLTTLRHTAEMARIGLLTDAADRLEKEIEGRAGLLAGDPRQDPKLEILRTEIELLKHELTLALARRQIQVETAPSAAAPRPAGSSDAAKAASASVSQLGQDVWVLERTGFKRGGFFVEIGATDGVLLNNTLLLEREFGWRGICIEPNPTSFEQLRANRSCRTVPDCVGPVTGDEVEFIFADVYGGIADYAHEDSHAPKRQAYRAAGQYAKLTTISLDDLLTKYGAPRKIDYLSIDTEGSELAILKAFPFDEWEIELLTVEHNFTKQRGEIRTLLEGFGYVCEEHEWDDWYRRTAAPRG